MRSRYRVILRTSILATVLLLGRFANAQLTLPYSGSCNSTLQCFSASNTGTGIGIFSSGSSGSAINGEATTGIGVAGSGTSTGSTGVWGQGVYAGVDASSTAGYGVFASSSTGTALYAISTSGVGVQGISSSGVGVKATSSSSQGVYGNSTCGTGATCIGVYGTSSGGNGVWGVTSSTSNAAVVGQVTNGGISFFGNGDIIVSGGAYLPGGGPWQNYSDIRIKEDIKSFEQGIPELMKIRPIRYKYNGLGGMPDDGKEYAGVIAQELERVMPGMVSSRMAKLHPSDAKDTPIKVVSGNDFTYLLIKAVQEQQQIINRQEARLTALEEGKPPMMSSIWSLGRGEVVLVVGLVPFGIFVAVRRRKKQG